MSVMAARPWTDADTARLRELHAQGSTLTGIAKEMGRSKSMVSRYAADAGLDFDRSQTANATKAHLVDAQARRAQLQLGLLEDAEKLRAEIWQPHEYIDHGGKDFVEVRWTQPQPHIADKLKLMQSVGIAIDRALKLAMYDSDDRDLPAVDKWLTFMTSTGTTGK